MSLWYNTRRRVKYEESISIWREGHGRFVARAIAREPVATFTEDYRMRHFLPSLSTVGTAVRRLISESRVDAVDGIYCHMDPLFAWYLRGLNG